MQVWLRSTLDRNHFPVQEKGDTSHPASQLVDSTSPSIVIRGINCQSQNSTPEPVRSLRVTDVLEYFITRLLEDLGTEVVELEMLPVCRWDRCHGYYNCVLYSGSDLYSTLSGNGYDWSCEEGILLVFGCGTWWAARLRHESCRHVEWSARDCTVVLVLTVEFGSLWCPHSILVVSSCIITVEQLVQAWILLHLFRITTIPCLPTQMLWCHRNGQNK